MIHMKLPGLNFRFDLRLRPKKEDGKILNVRYEDGLLFMDCRACDMPSSLGDTECVKCISSVIEENGSPSRLIMCKRSDIEYSEEIISVLTEISKIGSLTKAASFEKLPSRCSECRSSLPKSAGTIWDSFPEPRFDIIRLEAERSAPDRDGCEECLWKTIGFIDRLETMFGDLRKNAARKAFRLTEV